MSSIKENKIYKITEAFEALSEELPKMSYDNFSLLHNNGIIKKLTPRRIMGKELIKYLNGVK